MYMKRMIEIGVVSNGFVVECRVPIKPEKEEDSKKMENEHSCCCIGTSEGSCEKQYIAKDTDEVATIIQKLMPLLDTSFTSEEEFDAAFDKAAK